MKINFTELRRFDKLINSLENKQKAKLNNLYDKLAGEAKKQAKSFNSGSRKKINLSGRTIRADLRRSLKNNLQDYFNQLEKESIKSVKKDLSKTTKSGKDRIRLANISASKSVEGNQKWAKALADKQVKAFETELTNALRLAKETNPDVTDKELKMIIDDKMKAFKGRRLDATTMNEANRIQNQVRLEGFRESGLVQGIVFVAVLDDRTTKNCQAKNGTKIRLDDSRLSDFMIPNHANCRSMHAPILIKDNVRFTSDSRIDNIIEGNPVKSVEGMPEYFEVNKDENKD